MDKQNNSNLVTIAYGDGIGPEIMESVLRILGEAKAPLQIETVEVGKKLYDKGFNSGITEETWDSLRKSKIFLKAPITTPQGGGYKSLNVTIRKTLGLFVNLRPCEVYPPYVMTKHPKLDVVIVRENEEDLYAGIEYRPTSSTYQSIKLITEAGSEKIIRFAFEYAMKHGRNKVTCLSKDNIMKFSDGVFHRIFNEVAKEYPKLTTDHYIIDIGTARLASRPEQFDVIVTSNLYGDIISDVVAEISGSVGMAGSANIGKNFAMFEAIHGSAPDIAGKNIANPSGLLNGAIMMLCHMGLAEKANLIKNAWLKTLEDGLHTADIYNEQHSKKKLGTKEFTDCIIANLGEKPKSLPVSSFPQSKKIEYDTNLRLISAEKKTLVGVDIFFEWKGKKIEELVTKIQEIAKSELKLQIISCRGLVVWPSYVEVDCSFDHWRARFVPDNKGKTTSHKEIIALLGEFKKAELDFVQVENLYKYGDSLGFSLSQGE